MARRKFSKQQVEQGLLEIAVLVKNLHGLDADRVLANKEQIPRAHLAELAQQMPPSDITSLLRLKDCEDLSDQLRRRAQRLGNDLRLGERLVDVLFGYVEKLAAQDHPPGSPAWTDA